MLYATIMFAAAAAAFYYLGDDVAIAGILYLCSIVSSMIHDNNLFNEAKNYDDELHV